MKPVELLFNPIFWKQDMTLTGTVTNHKIDAIHSPVSSVPICLIPNESKKLFGVYFTSAHPVNKRQCVTWSAYTSMLICIDVDVQLCIEDNCTENFVKPLGTAIASTIP